MFRYRKYILLQLFILLSCVFSLAQNTDSLKLLLKASREDTIRLNLLMQICEVCDENEIATYAVPGIALSDKLLAFTSFSKKEKENILRLKASILNDMGLVSEGLGDPATALNYYKQSLKIRENLADKRDIAVLFINMGVIYKQQGNIPLALENYHKGLKIMEALNDIVGIATALNNLGLIYKQQGETTKALECYNKSIKIRANNSDQQGVSATLANIGYIHIDRKEFDKALQCYWQSIKIDEETGNKDGVAGSYNNIGLIYELQNNLPLALEYYNKSLKIDEEIKNKQGMAASLNSIGGIYIKQNNFRAAQPYCEKALQMARLVGYPNSISGAARLMKRIYQHNNDYKNALAMFELYIEMRDSVNNEKNRKAGIKKQMQYEYEKKAAADSVKNTEERKVKDAQIVAQQSKLKQEKTQRYALYGGLILIAGFLIFVFNRFKITQKQKAIIELQKADVDLAYGKLHEKNKEVLDSIFYARRIQRSLLTTESYIDKSLKRLRKS